MAETPMQAGRETPDEVAWLVERRGDGRTCECSHGFDRHTSYGVISEGNGRCSAQGCDCLKHVPTGQPQWWTGEGFSTDHQRALRLARRVDAERVIAVQQFELYARWQRIIAAEHIWTDDGRRTFVAQRTSSETE